MFACRLCSNLGSKIVQTPKSLASMLKNIVSYPPPNPCISEMAFSHRFQKVYTYPPLRNEILVLWTKNGENPENTRICSALAYSECPREICSNVRQFQEIIDMIQMCYHTNHCAYWPCFVNTRVFICYKTEKGTLTLLSFIRVTLRVLALLGQVTWTGTVFFRGG